MRKRGRRRWSAFNTVGGKVFLTIAVFRGLTFITPNQHNLKKPSACDVDIVASKKLLVFEVVSFSFFLFSSLVAEGLKLAINLLNIKDVDEAFRVNQWSYVVFWKIVCQNPKYVGMKIIKGRMKQECLQAINLCLNTWNMTSPASPQSRVSSSLNHK
ncbi:unnamed protein product [Camellia sinensis]